MDFSFIKFAEVEPTKPTTLSENHGKNQLKHGKCLHFKQKVTPEMLAGLSVTSSEKEKQRKADEYRALHWDKKGKVFPLGVKELVLNREFKKEFVYKMGISFTAIDTAKYAQYFKADKIMFKKATPIQGYTFDLEYSVVVHPHEEKDIGWLDKHCSETKTCYINFEKVEQDLAEQAQSKATITKIQKGSKAQSRKKTATKKKVSKKKASIK